MNLDTHDSKQIRRLGLIAIIFFGCLCALGLWLNKPLPTFLFGALSILGLGFFLFPTRLRPAYVAWLRIGQLLGRILTFLILTVTYYTVVTLTALIKRIFGGRPLPVRPDKMASSYWITRTEAAQPKERFQKRF